MKSKYQGHGYAKQALNILINKYKNLKLKKVVAGTAMDNTPSVSLLRSVGFELVNTETLSFHKDENGNDITFLGGNFELVL